MLNDLSIRNKLILLLAGPLVIILLLSALGAQDRRSSAAESQQVERMAATAQANANVADALQREAIYSAAYVGSDRASWEEELTSARKATDEALARALPRVQGDLGTSSSDARSSAELAVGAAGKLGFLRESIDQGLRPDQAHQATVNYADTASTFIALNTTLADANPDPQAAAELRTYAALAAYKASIATQGASLSGAGALGTYGSEAAYQVLVDAEAAEGDRFALLNALSDRELKGAVRNAMATDGAKVFEAVRNEGIELGPTGRFSSEPEAIVTASTTTVEGLQEVEAAGYAQIVAAARAAASSAERASSLFLIAAVVAIAGAAFAAFVLGRLITRPLRRLTEAADHLAGEQMPRLIESLKNPAEDELGYQIGSMRPIDIQSDDEIGKLARAFNEVQRVAGDVAAEQAQLLRKGIGEMFVNLARRNQALLDRQIEFIDELERGEEDPDQLDNLYKLDHLATRMRRNAESLLVLAGAEPPRRRGRPAPLANVVRAALAEVEDFGRIELLSFDEVLVASNAAADLAHLLSELMENATNFSPPETRVEVVGHKTKADGYVISVSDHGIGMSPDQIAEANESLAKPPLVGLAMTRSLGFIVVGRLASRHGIAVRMMPSAAGGVTAVVSIPPSLVVDTPGGMADALPMAEPPARLKQVFEAPSATVGATSDAPLDGGSFDAGALLEPIGGSSKPEPAVFAPPAAAAPTSDGGPVAWPTPGQEPAAPAAPAPLAAAPPPAAAAPLSAVPPAAADPAASLAAEVDQAVSPAMPAALSFGPPGVVDTARPDAPPPSVLAGGAAVFEAPRSGAPRPFFLEDAAPPRPFGAAPAGPEARQAAPAAAPEAPAAPRLFGGPQPAAPASPAADAGGLPSRTPRSAPEAQAPAPPTLPPAPEVAAPEVAAPEVEEVAPEAAAPVAPVEPVADAAPALTEAPSPDAVAPGGPKLDTRPPTIPRPAGPHTDGRPPAAPRAPVPPVPAMPPAALPAADAAPAAPAPAAPAAEAAPAETTTSSGLAKRVPRAKGASRAIPGSEVERNVAGTRRSPEEVRKMLAMHSAGRQRARTQEPPVPAGAPQESESHE